jgi:hypothetical protein
MPFWQWFSFRASRDFMSVSLFFKEHRGADDLQGDSIGRIQKGLVDNMRVLPEFTGEKCTGAPCVEQDEAVVGLQSSLRSSESLRGILECARHKKVGGMIKEENLDLIERVCVRYERHQKEVRDHCLDYFNHVPTDRLNPELTERTQFLMKEGKVLYSALRNAILASY